MDPLGAPFEELSASKKREETVPELLHYEKQLMNLALESSAISEAWKLNGGSATVLSPEALATENSEVTFKGETVVREWQGHLLDSLCQMDEEMILKFRDGRELVERLKKRRREMATESQDMSTCPP